jgi:hypothetical protein
MKQINGSIELTALFATKAKANGKSVLLIMINQHGIYRENGKVLLKFTSFGFTPTRENDFRTHLLKPLISKADYEALTEEKRQEIKIIGDLREFKKVEGEPEHFNMIVTGQIDLTRFEHAFKSIEGTEYLIINSENMIVGNKNGGIYLNFIAWPKKEQNQGATHIIKQSFPKKTADSMTDEQKKAQPIIGELRVTNVARKTMDESLTNITI